MCVQELDFDCAKTFNESLSREGNYDFKYKRRTGEDKSDGLCVYWNKLCWTCIHYTDVEFYHYDKDPLMDRHNVAQISVLKELSSGNIRAKYLANIAIYSPAHMMHPTSHDWKKERNLCEQYYPALHGLLEAEL